MSLSYFEPSFLIQIVRVVIVGCLLIIPLAVLLIYVRRAKKFSARQRTADAEALVYAELDEHLFKVDWENGDPHSRLQSSIIKLKRLKDLGRATRTALIDLLVYFRRNLKGSVAIIITAVYRNLHLKEFNLAKLQSLLWFRRAAALKEFQNVQVVIPKASLSRLLDDANQDVRVETYAALFGLDPLAAFKALDREKESLSRWHQLVLLEALTKQDQPVFSAFRNLNKLENHSLIQFYLEVILYYKLLNSIPSLLPLLQHENEQIRRQTIHIVGELNACQAEEDLVSSYPTETIENQKRILISLGYLSTGKSLDFLKQQFLYAEDFAVVKSAGQAIMMHPEIFREKTLGSLSDLGEAQEAVIAHLQDPLSKYHGVD